MPASADSKPTILIVDDTPANLDLLVEILKADFRTKVATHGEKALELAFSGSPPI
jgi:putative two-component system response regulator